MHGATIKIINYKVLKSISCAWQYNSSMQKSKTGNGDGIGYKTCQRGKVVSN